MVHQQVFFKLSRGTKQGDPLSPYLFILVLEILFIQVRNDPSVKGFKIGDIEIKLSAFADDTTFFVKNKESLSRLLNIMRKFGEFSSLHANVEKCEAYWIGRSKCRTDKPVNCKVTSLIGSSIKILGVHYSYNREVAEDKNFSDLTKSMKIVLNIWKQRYLTLGGKIQVFKSLIASKPVYIASMKSVPSYVVDSMQALHKDFIWNGRKPKIKHTTLVSDYTHGGLKDIDINCKLLSLKFSWIVRLLDESNFHPWKVIANEILRPVGGCSIFHINLSLSPETRQELQNLPSYYKDMINLFTKFADIEDLSNEEIMGQGLWDNSHILKQNSPIFDKQLVCKGMNFVSDLVSGEGQGHSWDTISSKFRLKPTEFLKWYGLFNAIPSQWKKKIQDHPPGNCHSMTRVPLSIICKGRKLGLKSVTSKLIYEELLSGIQTTPSAKKYFENKFKSNELDWPRIYQLPRSTSVHSKTRIFQYKVLNNILYLNSRLYRMGLVTSPLCSLCSLSNETTTHLFSECNISLALWKEIQNKVKGVLTLPNLNDHDVHLGFLTEGSGSLHLHNQILLSYKQFLYEHRKIKQGINITEFWKHLKMVYKIELEIAKKNCKLTYHNKKWQNLF